MRSRTFRQSIGLYLLATLCGLLAPVTGRTEGPEHSAHTMPADLPAGTFSSVSLYHLATTWTTDTEQPFQLAALRGQPQVIAMFYASCEYACPILVNLMQQLEAALPPETQAQVGFVLVTFDPARDTPSVLHAYRDKLHLDPQRWVVLHGQADDVVELAMLLGVKFKREAQGGFAHSNLLTVLNKEGEIAHRHEGLHAPLDATLAAIQQALTP